MKLTKPLAVDEPYLLLPIRNGNPKIRLQILHAGQRLREFEAELAWPANVDWWCYYDISALTGKEVILVSEETDLPPEQVAYLAQAIFQGEACPGMEDLYREAYRPQFHFTARRGWNNDPNGLVYERGEWHLFFQHNPFGIQWGNMHWGHAVSPDLVHWEELPTALFQKSLQDMAFSGGGIIDRANTSGFQAGPASPMILSFTGTGRGECLAYSLDYGRTFEEFTHNPVLRHTGRDPKILWYAPGQKWVMIVYEEVNDERGYAFYDGHDLKTWRRLDFLPGYFECPELFEIRIENQPQKKKWVIYGSVWEKYASAYQVGEFDGLKFTPQSEPLLAHYGPHFYAAQIFSHAPEDRRVLIGWLRGAAYPGMPFSQGMTVPLELSLRNAPEGLRLCFYPVEELAALRFDGVTADDLTVDTANRLLAALEGELFDISLTIRPDRNAALTVDIGGHAIRVDAAAGEVVFSGRAAPLPPDQEEVELRALVDRSVTEVFVERGYAAFAAMTLFPAGRRSLRLSGDGRITSLSAHRLRSIWPQSFS